MEASSRSHSSHLTSRLIEQIRNSGPIRFDLFMQTALYDPTQGYYCRDFQNRVGKQGDFFTSVSVGPLLGTLIAFQSWDWRRESLNPQKQQLPNHQGSESTKPFHLLECGAHDGVLASDVLNAAKIHTQHSETWPWLQYWILEPVPARQQWQREKIRSQSGESTLDNVRWISSWEEARHLNPGGWDLIFANELLDAFPIRRFRWSQDQQVWNEMAVGLNPEETALEWTPLPDSSSAELPECAHSNWLRDNDNDCLSELPDHFIVEWSPDAEDWWATAASVLSPGGRLWTLDYGHETDSFWDPARSNGTLRGYKKHQLVESVLANPGEQDLTAAVHFTAIRQKGEASGLVTETHPYETQARNLTEIFKKLWILKESLEEKPEAPWANFNWNSQLNRQFQTLTHPEQLGSIFRALIQRKPDQ